jgi:Methyltransferase domain
MSGDPVYDGYWLRKKLLIDGAPDFPVRWWWQEATALCEIERVYFDAIRHAQTALDVGAGDLRMMRKFKGAGFRGRYDTQDIGTEYPYTFRSLDEVTSHYDAILCLDVIEHLPLRDGMGLLHRLIDLLAPGGTLVIQTPNARCVRAPLGWDISHVHCYNAPDLWAFFTSKGLSTTACLVPFRAATFTPQSRLRFMLQSITARIMRVDYADNIAVIATKPAA